MNWKRKQNNKSALPTLLLLTFFFLCGIILGQVFAKSVPEEVISHTDVARGGVILDELYENYAG